MSTNLSKINRDKMLETISKIKESINDEETIKNLSLIEYELTKKKYGLVWEQHEEKVDEELKTKIPTFEEIKDKEFISNKNDKFNFLLEGDNLHSLYLLEKTHKEDIDFIYIDPPYNTGNKDFVYDDDFVEFEDGFKHSKWISFMERRLRIAHDLLKKEGIIFISIDDNEQAQLKVLCDEIFGEDNFVACMPRRTKSSGKTTNKISANHDYVLVYEKVKNQSLIVGMQHNDEGFKYEDEYVEERGKYKLNQTLDYDSLSYSSSLDYPIEIDGVTLYPGGDYDKYIERKNGNYKRADWAWRWSKDLFEFGLKNGFIVVKKGKNGLPRIYTKTYLNAKIQKDELEGYKIVVEERTKPLSSIEFVESKYSNDNAKKDLVKIFENSKFDYPKPVELLKTIISIYNKRDAIILDFFAGSGTTGQAVIELNEEDGGDRKFILCTNNENDICEDVTYQRLLKLNNGTPKMKPIKYNLKYYKTAYIPRINTDEENIQENLLLNINNLIQLENGISIDNEKIRVILDEEEIDRFSSNAEEVEKCERLYISTDILLTAQQVKIFKDNNVEVFIIPEYYFENEIREVQ